MRLREFLKENKSPYRDTTLPLSDYRGPYDPRSDGLEAYGDEYVDATDLWDEIEDMMEEGERPKRVEVSIDNLLATQDWLSDTPGDGPMWEELADHPVILDKDNVRYIIDGHNRIARAKQKGQKTIICYYFIGTN